MKNLSWIVYAVSLLLLQGTWSRGELLSPRLDLVKIPSEPTPSMRVSEVRPGMRGVCLTVFSGTKIEPFEVEVISVIERSGPGQAVIWMHSEDPRMLVTGPVQGMSGSPVYLWDGEEPNDPDDERLGGGRLIGAFAYGYANTKGCLIGVQPIEQMVPVGERIGKAPVDYARGARRALDTVGSGLASVEADAGTEARCAAWLSVLSPWTAGGPARGGVVFNDSLRPMSLPVTGLSKRFLELGLPLEVGGGLELVADGGSVGPPPAWIDPDAKLEPGSAFVVPLTTGDLDLAGVGTTTDVRPDGTVLAFGHSMNGEGSSALPMATGYVHFIVPSRGNSFKRGTPLRVAGTLLQDETAAVAGRAVLEHTMATMRVAVSMPGQPDRSYAYQVARHPYYTPLLSMICAARSLAAEQMPPVESTTRYAIDFSFDDGRTLAVKNTSVSGSFALYSTMMPVIASAMSNPYEPLRLSSVDVDLEVTEGVRTAELLGARLAKSTLEPGEEAVVYVEVRRYKGEAETVRLVIPVPEGTAEGQYQLFVGGRASHLMRIMRSQPHRMEIRGLDDLFTVIDEIENTPAEGLYGMLIAEGGGLAVGRQSLPDLPSSVRASITSSGQASVFSEVVTSRAELDLEIFGEYPLMLTVTKP
ncbi:hypothetical protein [Mucisphaera calidilacus]|uniref:Peptidase S55 domain-containing protein n=1 Tax=Mucisphaera calidilacus TaxID=2527982 RepID=A0A518BXV6_9BACT|nr:hypothetical protein [Mucisphaera calidilacus]QDU71817.1 hypothetical protein Pan265_16700 [Mucisphaera calidilacus]